MSKTREQMTRQQARLLQMLHQRQGTLFSWLPRAIIVHKIIPIFDAHPDQGSQFPDALRLASQGNLPTLQEMLDKNPPLILQAGTVVTPGGLEVVRTTLLEFAIYSGDFKMAEMIMPYYAKFDGGDALKLTLLECCRPHVEALQEQIESKKPTCDLKPLFEIIKNNPIDSPLVQVAVIEFREAVNPKRKTVGMHYEHYTTLIQAFDLLYDEWGKLSDNRRNYAKCDLVWQKIIGYLQCSLPAVDRFAFARAFDDDVRTPNFKYGHGQGSFPDFSSGAARSVGLGFDEAIYGLRRAGAARGGAHACLDGAVRKHMSSKSVKLAELMPPTQQTNASRCVIC